MIKIKNYLHRHPLSVLLFFLPLAFLAEFSHWNPMLIFSFSALSLVPLAGYIGEATESIAEYTGPKIGGLLNATLGNAAELIITLVAIKAGLLELVKASITGSIIGNLLLVMGLSLFLGGAKNGIQAFDRRHSSNQSVLLTLAVIALVIPSIFGHVIGSTNAWGVEQLSLGVAGVMILLYAASLFFNFKSNTNMASHETAHSKKIINKKEINSAIAVLVVATLGVVFMSEFLVGQVEVIVSRFGFSEFFLGIILIPIIGNVAEHMVAVQVAIRNQMDLSVEIAVSSSLQIALFVAPILVFISLIMGNPLTLVFNNFELIALGATVIVSALVCLDGESNWLEGLALIGVYIILGIGFFLLPT